MFFVICIPKRLDREWMMRQVGMSGDLVSRRLNEVLDAP